jgi:hypothetical protein
VNAPPNVTSPAFSPCQKISAVSENVSTPVVAAMIAQGPSANECAPRVQRGAFVHSS